MNQDYRDMLSALLSEQAEFLVVGAYAVASHGNPRATLDFDIWIRPSEDNAVRVYRALAKFGAILTDYMPSEFAIRDKVYMFGIAPNRIDILTTISGIEFEDAWPRRIVAHVEGVSVPTIGRDDLIANKRASGRLKDLADAEWLEQHPPDE